MAIGGFGRPKGENTTASPASSGGRGGTANLSAFIDQGSVFEGKLSFKDTVRIDGGFKGEIASENTLIVGESGEIEALIQSPTVVVSGSVTGNIVASDNVVLHKSARVDGDIESPSIVIEKGAIFNGSLKMGRAGATVESGLKSVSAPDNKPADGQGPSKQS